MPFGSRAVEQKIANMCVHFERVLVGPHAGRRGRGRGMYSLYYHYYDCVIGGAVTNNSSAGTLFKIGMFMIRISYLYR